MPELTRDGVRLVYDIRGPEGNADPPPFLFLHGWTCDRTAFEPQLEYFGRRHKVVALDQRGHGESDQPSGPYSPELLADDAAWVIDQLDLDNPVVIGHSMGGCVALSLAVQHPSVPTAIVLVDAPVEAPAEAMRPLLDQFVEQLHGPDADRARRSMVERFMVNPTTPPAVRDHVFRMMLDGTTPNDLAGDIFGCITAWDGERFAAELKVPALLIAADNPLVDLDKLRRLVPSSVVEYTPGAGHFNHLELPDQVNAMIERFLSGR